MTLDPPANWKHAAALERGDAPDPRPETAQFKLARLLAERDEIHSVHHQMLVAGRVLAFLPRINAWFDAEQAKPKPPQQPGELRQFSSQSDEDEALERAHWHLAGYREAMASLGAMGSVYAKDFDPDARGADEDDRRLSRERADTDAAANLPRVAS